MNPMEIIAEIEQGQDFAMKNGIVRGTHCNALFKAMNDTIEYYRREQFDKIYDIWTIVHKLEAGQEYLVLEWSLIERLEKILSSKSQYERKVWKLQSQRSK